MSNLPKNSYKHSPLLRKGVLGFWYHLAFVFYLLPRKYRTQEVFASQLRASDTDKFILFILLTMGELVIHGIWYGVMLYYYDALSTIVVYDVLLSISVFALALFSLSILFIIGVLVAPENGKRWLSLQGLYVFIYLCYGIAFTLSFGENTSAIGIMFLGGMTLGLLLLHWRFVLGAYILSVVALILFLINHQFQYIAILPTLYPDSHAYSHTVWQISYLYFVIPKATFMVLTLAQFLRVLEMQEKTIYKLSEIDPLTNIYNRRSMYIYMDYLWEYRTSWHSVGVIYFDLDKFKSINDNFGHAIGDKVLIHNVKITSQLLPQNAIFGRLGGEEFIIILPNLQKIETQNLAEQIREKLAQSPLILDPEFIKQNQGKQELLITASYGVACLYRESSNELSKLPIRFSKFLRTKATEKLTLPIAFDKLINRADEAMYQAKNTGRNRVVCMKTLKFVDNI